ncbi:MAG: diguanylate cyclase [Candidatus Marinimicrobia bacterium]|nr:diguanylate cyclase [Candidatus Neomarinimicrobiota bacterium]
MKKFARGNMRGTVLFIDIKNFLGISGILSPKETCQFVMEVIEPLSDSIQEHHGYVCQIQGDAIMAVFGLEKPQNNHADNAIECALEMQKILSSINPVKINKIRIPLSARIGICSGDLYACDINVAGRKEFTVLGKTVNLASRYQKINKFYNTKILIDEAVFAYIKNEIVTKKLDKVEIEGCSERTQIYEVLFAGANSNLDAFQRKVHYEKGLTHYLQGNWDEAIECFSRIAEDNASYLMIKRCKQRKALLESSLSSEKIDT